MFSNSLDPDSGVFQIRNQIFGRIRVRIQRIWIRNTALHSPLCLGCDGLPGGDHVEPVQQQGDGLRHDAGPVPRDQQEAAGRPGGHPPQEYHTQGNQNRLITVHLPHRILIWPHMRPKKVDGNPQIFSSHSILNPRRQRGSANTENNHVLYVFLQEKMLTVLRSRSQNYLGVPEPETLSRLRLHGFGA